MKYDEFLEKNDINHLSYINFTNENTSILRIAIHEDPREYLDVAKNAEKLDLIIVPSKQSDEYYKGLLEFVKNCRKEVKVEQQNLRGRASKDEFLKTEEIINNLLKEINPNWNIKQKLAFLHYKMGKLVSYVPDFNFNNQTTYSPVISKARNIWSSIANQIAVCNGITAIEQNILCRLGIRTTELSSGVHSYLLTETEEGNIITDATWDLTSSLYGAKPNYFGITYEELCDEESEIANSHRLKHHPKNVIKISERELRDIYYSIGIIGEDRKFPLPILAKTQEVNSENYDSIEEKLNAFFNMFMKEFSKEASHLSETRNIIQQCLENLGIARERITTKFVYSKEDIQCLRPYLVIHIDSEEIKNKIYLLNTNEMIFENIEIDKFDDKYRVHKFDTSVAFWKKYLCIKEKKQTIKDTQKI